MYIMTADGWKQLSPKSFTPPTHVPTLLEQFGIDPKFDGVANYSKAVAAYMAGEITIERCMGEMSRKR